MFFLFFYSFSLPLNNQKKASFFLFFFSSCFQILFKSFSSSFQVRFKFVSSCFQVRFKLLSSCFQVAFKLLLTRGSKSKIFLYFSTTYKFRGYPWGYITPGVSHGGILILILILILIYILIINIKY